jgi:hypothetical protein
MYTVEGVRGWPCLRLGLLSSCCRLGFSVLSGWSCIGPLVCPEKGRVYPYFPSGSTGRLMDLSNGSYLGWFLVSTYPRPWRLVCIFGGWHTFPGFRDSLSDTWVRLFGGICGSSFHSVCIVWCCVYFVFNKVNQRVFEVITIVYVIYLINNKGNIVYVLYHYISVIFFCIHCLY